MGLIARQLEAAGVATASLSSARDITEAVNPPRATYLDFPLGHTAGRVGEPEFNKSVVTAALATLSATEPGRIVDLPHVWSDNDDWKDRVMRPSPTPTSTPASTAPEGSAGVQDDRVQRFDTPQYQSPDDADAAASTHANQGCLVCAGIDY